MAEIDLTSIWNAKEKKMTEEITMFINFEMEEVV